MHYAIINKEEFIALYKFGEISFYSHRLINSTNEKEIGQALLNGLKKLPFFEYEEEVLIISLDDIPSKEKLEIRNIKELIPLSEKAKSSYERKFDTRLRFHTPRFDSILDDYFEYVNFVDHKNGAKALCQMCGCQLDGSTIVPDEDFKEALRRKNNGERSHSFQGSFFSHLLVYDRYGFFPSEDIGYLYDIGNIYANINGVPSFEGKSFHSFLEKNKDNYSALTLSEILKKIDSVPEAQRLRSGLTRDSIRLYIVGAIYLKYKNELREMDTVFDTSLKKVIGVKRKSHEFIHEFEVAIYLTGLFFGFQKFNKDFYDLASLRIFKDYSDSTEEAFGKTSITSDTPSIVEKSEITEEASQFDLSEEIAGEKKVAQPEFEITNEEMVTEISSQDSTEESSGTPSDHKVKTNNGKETPGEKKEDNVKTAEETFTRETATTLPKSDFFSEKDEGTLNKIEETFNKIGEQSLKISRITKKVGRLNVGQIKEIVKNDPKKRFEITKIGKALALNKATLDLFNTNSTE